MDLRGRRSRRIRSGDRLCVLVRKRSQQAYASGCQRRVVGPHFRLADFGREHDVHAGLDPGPSGCGHQYSPPDLQRVQRCEHRLSRGSCARSERSGHPGRRSCQPDGQRSKPQPGGRPGADGGAQHRRYERYLPRRRRGRELSGLGRGRRHGRLQLRRTCRRDLSDHLHLCQWRDHPECRRAAARTGQPRQQ